MLQTLNIVTTLFWCKCDAMTSQTYTLTSSLVAATSRLPNTQNCKNVVPMSLRSHDVAITQRRHDVAATSERRCFDVVCSLGWPHFLYKSVNPIQTFIYPFTFILQCLYILDTLVQFIGPNKQIITTKCLSFLLWSVRTAALNEIVQPVQKVPYHEFIIYITGCK